MLLEGLSELNTIIGGDDEFGISSIPTESIGLLEAALYEALKHYNRDSHYSLSKRYYDSAKSSKPRFPLKGYIIPFILANPSSYDGNNRLGGLA